MAVAIAGSAEIAESATGGHPTTSMPAAFRTLVSITGGDQIGSRAGIGVMNFEFIR